MDALGESLRFLKAERKNRLVSPTEHVRIDKHVEMMKRRQEVIMVMSELFKLYFEKLWSQLAAIERIT